MSSLSSADTTQETPSESSVTVPTTLEEIRKPVSEELNKFQDHFRETMKSQTAPLLNRISRYVIKQKGKQIRPLLIFLSAKTLGKVTPSTYHAATLVELLHTATLIHDDVVDNSQRRRGVFSINALWKNKIAVLFGDYLLSRGLLLAVDNQEHRLLSVVSDAVRKMSEGELLQIEKSRHLDIDEETYYEIISSKTASLFAACTASGAVSVGAEEEVQNQFHTIGETLGLSFQIRDDLFDFGVEDVGKPLGLDLQEKKITLPLIVALRNASFLKRHRIMRIVKQDEKTADDLQKVATFVDEYGGLEYAQEEMETLAGDAEQMLKEYPPSPSRQALIGLVEFTIERNK